MAKGMLKAALERHQGVDHYLQRQKTLQKQAVKRKKQYLQQDFELQQKMKEDSAEIDASLHNDDDGEEEVKAPKKSILKQNGASLNGDLVTRNRANGGLAHNEKNDDEDEQDEDEDGNHDDEEEEDIPFSDIASLNSEERGDVVPYQRLTINNHSALSAALSRISLPKTSIPFSIFQTVTSAAPTQIPDVNDDLNRELQFYAQSLAAAKEARLRLKAEGIPFTRPSDFFAEMVKSEDHMGRVHQRLVDDAANKKAAAEARRQRDLKKFGKAVQVAKQQTRDKTKRDTLDKINTLKRKRANTLPSAENEADQFDVAVDSETKKRPKTASSNTNNAAGANHKRQSKNEKYGFGGKKRHSKSGDAMSSAGIGLKGKLGSKKRLGKSKRKSKGF